MSTSPTHRLSRALAAVGEPAVLAFHHAAPELTEFVAQQMAARADLTTLAGANPGGALAYGRTEHVRFFEGQLRLKSADSLIDTLSWAYWTHSLRGIDPASFPISLGIWMEAVELYLDRTAAAEINAVYSCLRELHGELLHKTARAHDERVVTAFAPYLERYLAALLKPDTQEAIRITGSFVKTAAHITPWWEQVIAPAMHAVGELWAKGAISVGQEHMATAITQRVMGAFYPLILETPRTRGRLVVAASPGELHEIGPRMVADLFELHGWDVYYTGASTPTADIIGLSQQTGAHFLCISTTLVTSLPAVGDLIGQVRASEALHDIRILVGGQAFRADPNVWRSLGADGVAQSTSEGLRYITEQSAASR